MAMSIALDPASVLASAREALTRSEAHRRDGRHREGVETATQALALARTAGEPGLCARALCLLALHEWRLGALESAVAHSYEALPLLQREDEDAAERAKVLCTMAMAYNALGLHADALSQVMLALDAAQRSGQPSLESWALNRVGVTVWELDQPEEGERYLLRALEIARRIGGEEEAFSALNNLADHHLRSAARAAAGGKHDATVAYASQALAYASEAQVFALKSGNPHREAICLENLGKACIYLNRFEEALRHVERCDAISSDCGYVILRLAVVVARALAFRLQGRPTEAVRAYSDALLQAQALDERGVVLDVHLQLYEVHKSLGDPAQALIHHEQLLELERAQMKQRADTRTRLLLGRFDLELARHEAERARLDAEVQRLHAQALEAERNQLAEQARELGRRAFEDELTGLANRRRVHEELPARLAQVRERRGMLCIAALDLDHFKRVNDSFGHAVGDDVLRIVGQLLLAHTRAGDLVARIGGEEFLALFNATPLTAAGEACERLRAAIAAHDWESVAAGLRVTVSIGLCSADGALDVRHAIARADAALYAAKHAGRNRIEVATGIGA
jgi:diguanylate cyclase (GGDEF)-like protein